MNRGILKRSFFKFTASLCLLSASAVSGALVSTGGGLNNYQFEFSDLSSLPGYSSSSYSPTLFGASIDYHAYGHAETGSGVISSLGNTTFGFATSSEPMAYFGGSSAIRGGYTNNNGAISHSPYAGWLPNSTARLGMEHYNAASHLGVFTMDFGTTGSGYAINVNFSIGDIDAYLIGSKPFQDRMFVTAYDASGAQVASSSFLSALDPTNQTFTVATSGNSTVITGVNGGSGQLGSAINFNSGTAQISKVVITSDPIMVGLAEFNSGIGPYTQVGDISFSTLIVPEPSQALLIGVSMVALFKRRR